MQSLVTSGIHLCHGQDMVYVVLQYGDLFQNGNEDFLWAYESRIFMKLMTDPLYRMGPLR